MRYDVLIVGGGQAGARTAIELRERDFQGSIAIAGDEPDYPYSRPPLSKEYLASERNFDQLLIRPAQFWSERDVTLLTPQRVTAVDPPGHRVRIGDGEFTAYSNLVWAGGGRPRALKCPGIECSGIHFIRTKTDVDRIITELERASRIVIIGGGYIGLEAAAVLVGLGKRVTVCEVLYRVLARVCGKTLSRFYESEHRRHGVDLRLGTKVSGIESFRGRINGVRLEGGERIPCEMLIVGIGIVPAVEPLLTAGAVGGDGVAVDVFGRTSLPDVWAVGDCALHPNPFAGGKPIRIESVQNANDMATAVAGSIMGELKPYQAIPTFWSNQYDLCLKTVGISLGHDQAIVRGDPASRSFSIVYKRQGRVIALDCVNCIKDFLHGKALVNGKARIPSAGLADTAVPLNTLMQQT